MIRSALLTVSLAGALAGPAFAQDVAAPTQAGSPWPTMRHDARNTGASQLIPRSAGDDPWIVRTGKGIFSTPVIGADGTAYVGSADTRFSAVAPDGRVRWERRTGGIIDAAAALGAADPARGVEPVTIGSGDETLYQLDARDGRVLWKARPTLPPAPGQLVSWWEGNVAIGPDGDLFAGNTGGGAYRFSPLGAQRWVFPTSNSVWTTPAFGPDGSSYWGSLDLSIFSLDAAGRERWRTGTLGFVVSSPALAQDGTLYVASFDRRLYALDAATGAVRWTHETGDHIYASPALLEDAAGATRAIVIASTDGTIRSLGPDGLEQWRYDTGDPVRSSPALGRTPGGDGWTVYAGGADGRLYALDAATGMRRWSYDTTPTDAALRDRNDLNGSPALAATGVLIGGEHGLLTYVPYGWCPATPSDPRCDVSPGQPLGSPRPALLPVTPGGSTRAAGLREPLPPATTLTLRLAGAAGGSLEGGAAVRLTPRAPVDVERSGDGHHLFIRPRGLLEPGRRYALDVRARYRVGTGESQALRQTVRFRTAKRAARRVLARGDALRIRRLALPLPSFLTSVNQIGFDSYEWSAGVVRSARGRALLWVTGDGFAFPLEGRVRGADVALAAPPGVRLQFSFGELPLRRFELRGRLDGRGRMLGASVAADATCGEVPVYGPALRFIGLCNEHDTLAAGGTFLTGPERGPVTKRPAGLRAGAVRIRAGVIEAQITGGARDRPLGILLADARTGRPIALDHRGAQRAGSTLRIPLPKGAKLPRRLEAWVMAGVVPLARRAVGR